jgi:hypothetical protein
MRAIEIYNKAYLKEFVADESQVFKVDNSNLEFAVNRARKIIDQYFSKNTDRPSDTKRFLSQVADVVVRPKLFPDPKLAQQESEYLKQNIAANKDLHDYISNHV